MSTEIKSARGTGGKTLTVSPSGIDAWLTIDAGGSSMAVKVHGADLLQAVADELDVIVVERSELPEVQPRGPKRGYHVGAVRMLDGSDCDASECRATGLRWLALAEHLDTNPPLDEAQVERIAAAVRAEDIARGIPVPPVADYLPMARSLYRGGIRAPEVTP